MEHKRPNYVHISTLYSRTTCSYARQSRVIGFRKRCFVLIHSEVGKKGGGVMGYGGETSCSRGETGDIIFTEWNLRFIQNVASCYVLCLTKESVITATLVYAPVSVCATHTTRRSEWYECAWNTKWRRVRIEFPPGPYSDRSPDFEKPWSTAWL